MTEEEIYEILRSATGTGQTEDEAAKRAVEKAMLEATAKMKTEDKNKVTAAKKKLEAEKAAQKKREYEERQKQYKEDMEKRKQELEEKIKATTEAGKKASEELKKQIQEFLGKTQTTATTVSSSEALTKMKGDVSAIFKNTIDPLSSSLSEAWNQAKNKTDTLTSARERINDVLSGKIIGGTSEERKAGLGQAALEALSAEAMLRLQKDILTSNLSEIALIEQIAMEINKKQGDIAALGNDVLSIYYTQKAYISQYLSNTFGDKEFMKNLGTVISKDVSVYVDAWTTEMLTEGRKQLDGIVDNVFSKIGNEISPTTKNIMQKLDNLSRINILQSINERFNSIVGLEGLRAKLESSTLGKAMYPFIRDICKAGMAAVSAKFSSSRFASQLRKFTEKFQSFKEKITAYKELVIEKVKMLKEYVNQLREQAMNTVMTFANQVVDDIKSKISVEVGNAVGSMIGGL